MGTSNQAQSGLQAAAAQHLDMAELTSLTRAIIDIPSPMGYETNVAEYIHHRFLSAGMRSQLQEVEDGRCNVVGRIEGEGTGAHLLYVGHMDTTWGGDEEGIHTLGPGYQPTSWQDGEWIYGMGAYNMKSGLAALVHAAEAIAKSGVRLAGDLIIAGVVGETSQTETRRHRGRRYRGTGVGARFLVTNGVMADAAVIAEPTMGRVNIDSGGFLLFEVTTIGNPGSTFARGAGADPKEATDAIEAALRLRTEILAWSETYIAAHPYNGDRALNVTLLGIDGGHPFHPSKVPAFCHSYWDVKLMPGQRQIDVEVEFKNMVRQACERLGIRYEIAVLQNTPGAQVHVDEPIVRATADRHQSVTGHEPQFVWEGYHADTTALTRFGIPTICYGPGGRMRDGGSGYYAKEGEMCFIPDLLTGSEVFVALADDFCNRSRKEARPNVSNNGTSVVHG